MNISHLPRAINQSEIEIKAADKFSPHEQPLTQLEGYTNLSLIKEEDFNKLGVGHLQGKNAIKRVYQNKRVYPGHTNLKSRKASEATTITQNGGAPVSRKEYTSVENRYETPLKLPNLRSTGAKKNSGISNTSP